MIKMSTSFSIYTSIRGYLRKSDRREYRLKKKNNEHRIRTPNLQSITPLWRIDNDSHQATCNDTSTWQCDDPAHIDPSDHTPVDRLEIAGTETHADSCARNALGGRDGQSQSRGHDDGEGTAEFHRETT